MLIKMILRSWSRHPLNTFISLTSLTIGVTCSVLLLMFYLSEARIARSMAKVNNLHVMLENDNSFNNRNIMSPSVLAGNAITMADAFGEVENHTILAANRGQFTTSHTSQAMLNQGRYYQTTASLCDLVNIPVIEGDLRRTLSSSSEIALTYGAAMELFGSTENLIGRTLTNTTFKTNRTTFKSTKTENNYTVTAILDNSHKTMFQGIAVLSAFSPEQYTSMQGSQTSNAYAIFQLRNGVSGHNLAAKVKADTAFCHTALYNQADFEFRPIEDVYFASEDDLNFKHSIFNNREPSTLLTGLGIAIVLLIISAFNYVNITLTRASDRLKCIAGQRIMGATRMSVRWQTIADTALQVALSFAVALILLDHFAIGKFNSFMNADIATIDIFHLDVAAAMVALMAILIFIPSLYILVKLEVKNPLEVFLSSRKRKVSAARNIVIAQFTVATIMVIVGLNVWRQTQYICQTIDQSNNIFQIKCEDTFSRPQQFGSDDNGLTKPFIDLLSTQASINATSDTWLPECYQSNDDKHSFAQLQTSPGTIDFYGLKLTHGRDFDQSEKWGNVIVNETLLRIFEIEPPYIGKTFDRYHESNTIIGVVEDFKFSNVKHTIEPLILTNTTGFSNSYRHLAVRHNGSEDSLRKMVASNWAAMYPDRPQPTVTTLQRNILDSNPEVNRMGIMVGLFTIISLLLALMGLFGISWYTVQSRRREIAIRKVFGSTAPQILAMLCNRFFRWIAISIIIAIPSAYFISNYWLEGFAYRVENSFFVIIISILSIALIVLLTVIWQSIQAANANPAKSIKTQ